MTLNSFASYIVDIVDVDSESKLTKINKKNISKFLNRRPSFSTCLDILKMKIVNVSKNEKNQSNCIVSSKNVVPRPKL